MNESLNRAFLYGESVFTTLRMMNGVLKDWGQHFERLKKGVEFVYGPFTNDGNWSAELKDRLETSFQKESGNKILRLTVYRHQARGLRRMGITSVSDLKIHMSATPYEDLGTEGRSVKLRTCLASLRPSWWPEYLKAGSYLNVILAQKMYLKGDDDDLLFLSGGDTVFESSIANIFIVRHNRLYTPPTGPNVLDGIMRRKVIEVAHEFFDEIAETETSMEQLWKADGVFGTNSVRGPFLVNQVDDVSIHYSKEFLEKFEKLRERVL